MNENEKLDALFNAAHNVQMHAFFFPEGEYGTPEMIISSEYIYTLRLALGSFEEYHL